MGRSSIEFDTVLELCRDQHRRIILAVLTEQRRPLTLNDLTKTVVKYNHRTPIMDVSEEVLTDIQLSLYHVHIPKLEECGVVEYDREQQLVEPTATFDQLQPHLSAIVDVDPELDAPLEL